MPTERLTSAAEALEIQFREGYPAMATAIKTAINASPFLSYCRALLQVLKDLKPLFLRADEAKMAVLEEFIHACAEDVPARFGEVQNPVQADDASRLLLLREITGFMPEIRRGRAKLAFAATANEMASNISQYNASVGSILTDNISSLAAESDSGKQIAILENIVRGAIHNTRYYDDPEQIFRTLQPNERATFVGHMSSFIEACRLWIEANIAAQYYGDSTVAQVQELRRRTSEVAKRYEEGISGRPPGR
jgi:hypothetical protein